MNSFPVKFPLDAKHLEQIAQYNSVSFREVSLQVGLVDLAITVVTTELLLTVLQVLIALLNPPSLVIFLDLVAKD